MKKAIAVILSVLFVLIGLNVFAAQVDRKGSKDHPLLTRMADFYISGYEDKDFDKNEFLIQDGKKVSRVSVEGHKYYLQYDLNQGANQPGALKVVRNIENALTKIGGKVLFEGERPYRPRSNLRKAAKKRGWRYQLGQPYTDSPLLKKKS